MTDTRSMKLKGVLFSVLSAMIFGTSPIFFKTIAATGINTTTQVVHVVDMAQHRIFNHTLERIYFRQALLVRRKAVKILMDHAGAAGKDR